MVGILLLLLLVLCSGGHAQSAKDDPALVLARLPMVKSEIERDRALRLGFEAALALGPDDARPYLPLVINRTWLGEMNFHEICALAWSVEEDPPDAGPEPQGATGVPAKLVLAAGLHNPALALREFGQYLGLTSGRQLFEQFVLAAPDEAMGLASGTTKTAREVRELLAGAKSPEMAFLARLAERPSIDLPRRSRVAIFAKRVARGELSFESALRIADSTHQFFAAVLDMRIAGDASYVGALDRVLENESLVLCRAAQENLNRTLVSDLAQFRARDLYALLALGRAEATPAVFAAVFDRLLLPKLKAETPKGASLTGLLDRTRNWELRDFAAAALAAGRFDGLLSVIGTETVSRLARGIDQLPDPLTEAMRLSEIVDGTSNSRFLQQMASVISEEFVRCRAAGDLSGTTLYGLLAVKLSVDAIAAPYAPSLIASETLDTALLFGKENDCIERHFFYDDDDGVESFASFRKTYEHDPAWEIEDRGVYVHLTGHGIEGRRIEIFANVPIDGHLAKNRALEGEAQRRQQAIAAALNEGGLVPTVIVHRGHSFWVERTLSYIAKTARLVILGSCGGATQIHAVIEASHDAEVIATRGIGGTEINDGILKALNDRILKGERTIQWSSFWQELKASHGKSGLFRDYVAPNQNSATVFLRAYHRFLDASN